MSIVPEGGGGVIDTVSIRDSKECGIESVMLQNFPTDAAIWYPYFRYCSSRLQRMSRRLNDPHIHHSTIRPFIRMQQI